MLQDNDSFQRPILQSFLFSAAEHGFVEIARLLIRANANVNQQCYNGNTPLLVASRENHEEIVGLLLQQPTICVDLVDNNRYTALHVSAFAGYTSIVQQLLDANASVDAADDMGETALIFAATEGHEDTVRLLLRHKADPNGTSGGGWCSLSCAAQDGHEGAIAALLEANAMVDLAVNSKGITALMEAAEQGHLTTAKRLLAAGANVHHRSAKQETALHRATRYGHERLVDLLLKADADTNAAAHGVTPLLKAARYGNTACISALLAAGADVNATDFNGETALIYAVRSFRSSAAKLLLDRGANWLLKGQQSARQLALNGNSKLQALFQCAVCGWDKMCCAECRKKYCVVECDKFSG